MAKKWGIILKNYDHVEKGSKAFEGDFFNVAIIFQDNYPFFAILDLQEFSDQLKI